MFTSCCITIEESQHAHLINVFCFCFVFFCFQGTGSCSVHSTQYLNLMGLYWWGPRLLVWPPHVSFSCLSQDSLFLMSKAWLTVFNAQLIHMRGRCLRYCCSQDGQMTLSMLKYVTYGGWWVSPRMWLFYEHIVWDSWHFKAMKKIKMMAPGC